MCEKEKYKQMVRETLKEIEQEKKEYFNENVVDARTSIVIAWVIIVGFIFMILAIIVPDFIREKILEVLVIILVGSYIYASKFKSRLIYGGIEVFFGIVSIWDGLSKASIFSIGGGFYVIIRGLDNMGQGITNTHYKPVWEKFWNSFFKIFGVNLNKNN